MLLLFLWEILSEHAFQPAHRRAELDMQFIRNAFKNFSKPVPADQFEAFLPEKKSVDGDSFPRDGKQRRRRLTHDRFTYQAMHDPLTGLYNLSGFGQQPIPADFRQNYRKFKFVRRPAPCASRQFMVYLRKDVFCQAVLTELFTMNQLSLEDLLNRGRRPILVEFDPPRQTAPADFFPGAKELCEAGADVITIADCPIGRANIDACMLAAKMKRELGVQVLPHMACRDRNLNAIKALLLGLDMEEIHSVLLITGDPVAQEDRDSIRGVFQMNSRTLAKILGELSEAGKLPPFFLCGGLNVNARNFDAELDRARKKEESGIRAFLTQPICSVRGAENLKKARSVLHGRLMGGLFPIVSYKNACFLKREVAGMDIDDSVVAAYEGLNREEGEETALVLCRSTAREITPYVDGYYIMTPFQRIALVKRVMAEIRSL